MRKSQISQIYVCFLYQIWLLLNKKARFLARNLAFLWQESQILYKNKQQSGKSGFCKNTKPC